MPTSTAGLGLYDDMDALLSPAEPRSDAMIAIRAEAALAADRKMEADIKASAAAKAAAGAAQKAAAGAAQKPGGAHVMYTSQQLASVLDLHESLLRGVPLPTMLAGFGSLFADHGAVVRVS